MSLLGDGFEVARRGKKYLNSEGRGFWIKPSRDRSSPRRTKKRGRKKRRGELGGKI